MAQRYHGHISDITTHIGIPFATIRFGQTGQGTIASLEGDFQLPDSLAMHISSITVSALGYQTKRIFTPLPASIYLQPGGNELAEITITPPYNKIRRIINAAINNKDNNNPDKYPAYRCRVYYKMLADATVPGQDLYDTGRGERPQHLLLSESYSIRTWERPQKLHEEVLASRFSGLLDATFTPLVTDVLPFHAYTNYLTINNKDYHNPISPGFERYYTFNLADEITSGTDTIWVFSFRPRGNNANELTGTVHIHSRGYGISSIIARVSDTAHHLQARLEQQHGLVVTPMGNYRWFPRHLNYIINWQQHASGKTADIQMKGYSSIDSVTFPPMGSQHFDKAHTIQVPDDKPAQQDSVLRSHRPQQLTTKEQNTYTIVDSMGEEFKLSSILRALSRLPEGKLKTGPVYIDLLRLASFNRHEGWRLGVGAQTSEQFLKWLSVGGWGGYGIGDKQWKYGALAEIYFDKAREFALKAEYVHDIGTPGMVAFHPDIDHNYLRRYLLDRADSLNTIQVTLSKKLGYWTLEATAMQQDITPLYSYLLDDGKAKYSFFRAQDVSLHFRYAYAERTAPFFGAFYGMSSNYPIAYGKISYGNITNTGTRYLQAVAAVAWNKHINRVGYEHVLLSGGYSISNHPLPLSKLFAGNGYRYSGSSWTDQPLYTFGGLLTMLPYAYYSDQFINLCLRHDADWKLYKLNLTRNLSSVPNPCVQYSLLYGSLKNQDAQQLAAFSVPDACYHEAGILLNNLVRFNVNIYYITLTAGYFYHFAPGAFQPQAGRFSYGLGLEL